MSLLSGPIKEGEAAAVDGITKAGDALKLDLAEFLASALDNVDDYEIVFTVSSKVSLQRKVPVGPQPG